MRQNRHSLAGTNGIPLEEDRVYVEVECGHGDELNPYEYPVRLTWPDGRSWGISASNLERTYGREIFGNYVERYDITIRRKHRTLWRERGRWFVRRKQGA